MSDYQAIFDAVRSRISGGNVGEIVAEAARQAFDLSYTRQILQQEFCIAASEMARPSAIYRPSIRRAEGNKWCALYGQHVIDGVAGFGDTPEEAMRDFDKNWRTQRLAHSEGRAS